MGEGSGLDPLVQFIEKVPGVRGKVANGYFEDGNWWAKFTIDIRHRLAWNVVQEFGFVLNYLSLESRLPTVFKPVSPPPYMNGGPADFLSWVIESTDPKFPPAKCREWLEGRLPRPVEDESNWKTD